MVSLQKVTQPTWLSLPYTLLRRLSSWTGKIKIILISTNIEIICGIILVLTQLLLHIRSISLGSFDQLHHLMWVGVPFCPAVVFVVGVGWRYGPGASGGGVLGGFGAGAALGLYGVLVTLGCCFSGGYMWRCWGCLCWRGLLFRGWSGGGAWGSGGALPPGWGYGWAWGAWVLVVCRRKHGLVHALGPGSGVGVFDASVPPQGGGVQ